MNVPAIGVPSFPSAISPADQQRQGHEKPDVSLHIVEKGNPDPAVKVAVNR